MMVIHNSVVNEFLIVLIATYQMAMNLMNILTPIWTAAAGICSHPAHPIDMDSEFQIK